MGNQVVATPSSLNELPLDVLPIELKDKENTQVIVLRHRGLDTGLTG